MLADYKDKHNGEACVVIGNGPSLDKTPLAELTKNRVSFGSNKIYNYPFEPTYYTVIDHEMLHDCIGKISELKSKVFVPRGIPVPGSEQLQLRVSAQFSEDIEECVYIGGTVTFVNLQLAYYMGFETVLMVGVDHRYNKAEKGGVPGSKFIADGDDPDHFGKGYFEAGKLYNRPELEAVNKKIYPLAQYSFSRVGRKIINLTPDSGTDAFPTDSWDKWL